MVRGRRYRTRPSAVVVFTNALGAVRRERGHALAAVQPERSARLDAILLQTAAYVARLEATIRGHMRPRMVARRWPHYVVAARLP